MKISRPLALFCFFCFSFLSAAQTRGFLTSEEIDLFYKQGYLLKPKALEPEELDRLQRNISSAIEKAYDHVQSAPDPIISEKEQFSPCNESLVVFKRHPDESISICRINGCSGIEPDLLETTRSAQMVHTFFELLGTSELEHLISQIHPKLPGDNVAFPRHRDIQFRKLFDPDWQDILGNGSYAVCIIPIDPMTPENGGLWIDRNNYPEPQGLEEDLLWLHAEPGDLLFMHPHLFHGSGPNLSSGSRKTLLTGFCAYGANHKRYPGAHVNAHLALNEEHDISILPSHWEQDTFAAPGSGH